MSKQSNTPYPWKLAIFPLLEAVFFIAAILVSNLFGSLLLLFIAAILLSFSIHIFFHECVHFRPKYPQWVNIIKTLFLGIVYCSRNKFLIDLFIKKSPAAARAPVMKINPQLMPFIILCLLMAIRGLLIILFVTKITLKNNKSTKARYYWIFSLAGYSAE